MTRFALFHAGLVFTVRVVQFPTRWYILSVQKLEGGKNKLFSALACTDIVSDLMHERCPNVSSWNCLRCKNLT